MKLISNWKQVTTRAWSMRFMLAAALLSGVEVLLSLTGAQVLGVSPGFFAAASGIVSGAALLSRLLAQSNLGGSDAA